jgi:signal transduction histidine kinase
VEQRAAAIHREFDGLGRHQLLIYAQEVGEHFRRENHLQRTLSEREVQVRSLVAASVAIQEEERQWIAYEVHDRIAQTLASAFQQLQKMEAMTRGNESTHQIAVRASVLIREAIRESRNIMNDLHPPMRDEFGIVPLIEEELRHLAEETRCETRLLAEYHVRPQREVEVALYRIFHEALINIRRHAKDAGHVVVSLKSVDHTVSLEVKDDGIGFDPQAEVQRKRVGGLMSMRRRADVINGALDVTSRAGLGTLVSVSVPFNVRDGEGSYAGQSTGE